MSAGHVHGSYASSHPQLNSNAHLDSAHPLPINQSSVRTPSETNQSAFRSSQSNQSYIRPPHSGQSAVRPPDSVKSVVGPAQSNQSAARPLPDSDQSAVRSSQSGQSAARLADSIRLDRTPTDEEINWLWQKVRTCLNASRTNLNNNNNSPPITNPHSMKVTNNNNLLSPSITTGVNNQGHPSITNHYNPATVNTTSPAHQTTNGKTSTAASNGGSTAVANGKPVMSRTYIDASALLTGSSCFSSYFCWFKFLLLCTLKMCCHRSRLVFNCCF